MGREIFTIIKDKDNKIVWSSVELFEVQCDHGDTNFYGRDRATDVIARWANEDSEGDYVVDFSDPKIYTALVDELTEVQDEEDAEYDMLHERLDALKSCRARAMNLNLFYEFDAEVTEMTQEIKERRWNKAVHMQELMADTRRKAASLVKQEPFGTNIGDYKICWYVSE